MNKTKRLTLSNLLFLCFAPLFLGCSSGKETADKPVDRTSLYAFSNYGRTFSDMNETHLSAARTIGIEPISSREEAENKHLKLDEVESNELYEVDKLTHSLPLLVPQAKQLLERIGKNFADSLTNKNIHPHLFYVTSVLRTEEDVKSLKRRNGNSSSNSAHAYATTIDISYVRFKIGERKNGWFGKKESGEEVKSDISLLKSVLAQVLFDLRKEGVCYVRYEVKQGCFHITAR